MHTHLSARARPHPPGPSRWRRAGVAVAATLTALTVVIVTSITPSPLATASPGTTPAPNGFLVFNDDDGNLWSVATHMPNFHLPGNGLTNLTAAGAGKGVEPRVSPDGRKIAFEWEGNVYTANIDGTGRTQLTSDGGRSAPAWHPNGTKIASAKYHGGSTPFITIDVMNTNGTGLVQTRTISTWDADHNHLTSVDHLTYSANGIWMAASGRRAPWPAGEYNYANGYATNAGATNTYRPIWIGQGNRVHRYSYRDAAGRCFEDQLVEHPPYQSPISSEICPIPRVRDSGVLRFKADGTGTPWLLRDALGIEGPEFLPDGRTVWSDLGDQGDAKHACCFTYSGPDAVFIGYRPNLEVVPHPAAPKVVMPVVLGDQAVVALAEGRDPAVAPDHNWLVSVVGTRLRFLTGHNGGWTFDKELPVVPRNLDWGRAPA